MDFDTGAPYQPGSPWPIFRRTLRNTGSSPILAEYRGDRPWFFQTGKGLFSTPIIDASGVIYTGSADRYFYAIDPDGSEKWRFQTGEIIDSAAALPADQPGTILVPSGDGYLYRLRTSDGSEIWRFDARIAPRESYNDWFEANVAIGPDGTVYAGNTNFNYYAITPEGQLKWTYETGSNAWSAAAFSPDGSIYWGSCDTFFHAVWPSGKPKWKRRTLGFISASAAIGLDGTVYAGSFDSNFYALEPDNGKVRWKFKSHDHIYGSAALLEADGHTRFIIFGSTDGILYALTPEGDLAWQFDSGAPIRSSPVLSRAPGSTDDQIVYFGNGDGKLYALQVSDGRLRWSFDTTGAGDALPDRNDLNGSPALGQNGIYIGGEHGQLWYVPYDYPVHHPEDPRGSTSAGSGLPADFTGLYFVTAGGQALPELPDEMPAATLICLKLVVRKDSKTIPGRFYNSPFFTRSRALRVTFDPPAPFRYEVSGDGRFITIIPGDFLEPGIQYRLAISGNYYLGGLNFGNLTIGGRQAGTFNKEFVFSIEQDSRPLPLRILPDEVSVFEWARLSVPIPPMLASLNQIGFDSMQWLIAPIVIGPAGKEGRRQVILWASGARRNETGHLVIDPESDFHLPLTGTFLNGDFILSNRNFKMAVTGIPIPFNIFQLRGKFDQDLRVEPSARAFAETQVLSIPTFGIPMIIAGLANKIWKKLFALATFITGPYDADGGANKRPAGVHVSSIEYQPATRSSPGAVQARFRLADGVSYRSGDHHVAILLVDKERLEVINLDYHNNLEQNGDANGNLLEAKLTLPAETILPDSTSIFIITDVFPIYERRLSE